MSERPERNSPPDAEDEDRPRRRAAREEDDEDRPIKRRSRDDDDDDDEDRPRKKKRKRKKRQSGAFDPLEALPMDYPIQVQIAGSIGSFIYLIGLIMMISKSNSAFIMYILGIPFWSWACAAAARSAGRSAFNGFYGLLGLIGFLIVYTTNNQGNAD